MTEGSRIKLEWLGAKMQFSGDVARKALPYLAAIACFGGVVYLTQERIVTRLDRLEPRLVAIEAKLDIKTPVAVSSAKRKPAQVMAFLKGDRQP